MNPIQLHVLGLLVAPFVPLGAAAILVVAFRKLVCLRQTCCQRLVRGIPQSKPADN